MNKGWKGESYRHSLARKGIYTVSKKDRKTLRKKKPKVYKHLWSAGNSQGYSLFKTKKEADWFKKGFEASGKKSIKVSKVIP